MKKVGKPLKFKTPKELKSIVDGYFNDTTPLEWTVTGLALVVGSKQLLNDYEKRDGYSEIVHYAKLKVENAYEVSLRKNGRAGDIFALKNFGRTDKQEVYNTGDVQIQVLKIGKKG